jgi:hypothetical protein
MYNDIQINLALVDTLTTLFKGQYQGGSNAVKKDELTARVVAGYGIITCERRIRHAIAYIRLNDLLNPGFIISDNSNGYWLSYDETEMDTFLNKQLNRMTNQFQNLKQLHQRIRYAKNTGPQIQQQLF